MKSKKTALFALCLGVVLSLGFAACGGDKGGNEGSGQGGSSSEIVGGSESSMEQSSESSESSSGGHTGTEIRGETIADANAWTQAIVNSLAKTNAAATYTATTEERMGEYYMMHEGSATVKVADGKVHQYAAGVASYYYPNDYDGTIVSGEEDFVNEMYISIVDGVAIEWDRYNGGEWQCSPYHVYEERPFTATMGGMLNGSDIFLEYFVDMYAMFQKVDDAYVFEMEEDGTYGKVALKFVDGLLYSYDSETSYAYTQDGVTTVENLSISMTISYGNATVGELPPMTWEGGEDGPDRPSKPDDSEECPHSFSEYIPNGDATCTEDGTKTAWCDYGCGETDTVIDEGSKLDHDFTDYKSNGDATCEEDGTKTAWCDYGCGETDTVTDEGSKLDHDFTNYKSNGDATCEEDGTKTATCDNGCGETDTVTDEGSATGCRFTDYKSNGDATCTEDGTKTATCDNGCGETDTKIDEGSAKGHSFTDYKTDATGKQTATCDNGCGTTDVKGEAVQDEAAWKKAIANSIGKTNATVGYVSTLRAEDEYGSYLEQKGNGTAKLANKTWYELVTGTTVTNISGSYTEAFMTEMYIGYVDDLAMQWYRESTESEWECYPFNVDGPEFTGTLGEFMTMRSVPIAYFSDMFAAFTYENGTYVYEADITDNGEVGRIEIKFLNGLLYSYEQTVTIHETVEGIDGDGVAYMHFVISYADVDSIELPPMTWERPASEGLQFTLNSDKKSYSVTGMGSCQDTYVVIPATYENYPVTGIGAKAFNNRKITAIGIPASIVSIGSNAFNGCTTLKKVNIKDLAAWCNVSFANAMANPLYFTKNLHLNNELITQLVIPEGITEISSLAFYNCTGLTEVAISDSVTSIGAYAFQNCSGLTKVVIGSGITNISSSAFQNCSSLTEMVVENNNTVYQSLDGNLYSKDGTTLIKYALGKTETSFRIPDGVTRIDEYAFRDSKNLTEIIISDSVADIADNAFYGCSNLQGLEKVGLKYLGNENNPYLYLRGYTTGLASAVIESGCKFIGGSALSNCSGLTEIIIPESVTSVGSEAFKGCTSLTIYCEIANQPSAWSSTWNSSACSVVWDCKNNTVADDGYIYVVIDGLRYGIKEGAATVAKQPKTITEATIPSEIVYSDEVYPVTSIAESAFDGNYSLKTLAFSQDGQLKTIGVYAFRSCQGLTEIVLPDGVVSIEAGAFYTCSRLETIVIPNSVTSIGNSAFESCSQLQYTIKDELKYLGNENNPYVCLIAPTNKQIQSAKIADECHIIASYALSSCTNLTSLTIGDGVAYIGEMAFYWCYRLTAVAFGGNGKLRSIADSAFWSCSGLVEVVIPDGVTHIGTNAFYGCTNLTKIVIPDTVTDIGDNDFGQKLADVTCPAAVIPYLRMHYVQRVTITSGDCIPKAAFSSCDSLTKVVIPNTITSIGDSAFYGCSSLTEIVLPDGVTSIGDNAFRGCSKLTKIVIPDTVTSIGGDWTFVGCTSLKEITCPALMLPYLPHKYTTGTSNLQKVVITSGDSIKAEAFSFCSNLTEVVIADSVTSIGNDAFSSCGKLTSIKFNGTVEQWNSITKGSSWNLYVPATKVVCSDGEVAL